MREGRKSCERERERERKRIERGGEIEKEFRERV